MAAKCRRAGLRFLLFVVAVFAAIILLQAVFTPWARSLTGGPTLTGRWIGEVRRPDGGARPVYVYIEGLIWGADEYGCLRGCDVQGAIRVCAASGLIQKYTFDGDVAGRNGSKFSMLLRKPDDTPYGWILSNLNGEWSGADALRLAGEWISDPPRHEVRIVSDSAGNTVMDPPPEPQRRSPVSFTLRRGHKRDFTCP